MILSVSIDNKNYGLSLEDRMFLEVQDFEFCPNLIKFYEIYLI